jgi:hypothetical protein
LSPLGLLPTQRTSLVRLQLSIPQAEQESTAFQPDRADDAETQWRHFVKNMEAWNRIVMNLELTALRVA